MPDPVFIIGLLGAMGLFFLALAGARVRRRPGAALRNGLCGCTSLALAALFGAVGFNLLTYQRLSAEHPVATLTFEQLADQRFRARLELPEAPARVYKLAGDQWQLDARFLKWRTPLVLFGLEPRYRLERLTGRYRTAEEEQYRLRSVHQLTDTAGLDLWAWAERYPTWLPMVDANYGSATYLPMRDGARYEVRATASGLLARPANDIARRAAGNW